MKTMLQLWESAGKRQGFVGGYMGRTSYHTPVRKWVFRGGDLLAMIDHHWDWKSYPDKVRREGGTVIYDADLERHFHTPILLADPRRQEALRLMRDSLEYQAKMCKSIYHRAPLLAAYGDMPLGQLADFFEDDGSSHGVVEALRDGGAAETATVASAPLELVPPREWVLELIAERVAEARAKGAKEEDE